MIAELLTVNPPLLWRTCHNHWDTVCFGFFQIKVPPTPTPSRTPYSEPSANMKNQSQPLSYCLLWGFFKLKCPPPLPPAELLTVNPPLTWRTSHNHWATLFFFFFSIKRAPPPPPQQTHTHTHTHTHMLDRKNNGTVFTVISKWVCAQPSWKQPTDMDYYTNFCNNSAFFLFFIYSLVL